MKRLVAFHWCFEIIVPTMMKPLFAVLFSLLLTLTMHAQEVVRCYTTEMQQQLRNQGSLQETDEQFERWIAERIAELRLNGQTESEYVIPVVVHIIYQVENNLIRAHSFSPERKGPIKYIMKYSLLFFPSLSNRS
jgi:hypothetical protein